jgi:hypothetical protein
LNKHNWFENVPCDVWHNPQELSQVDHTLGFQSLSVDAFQNLFSNIIVCVVK